MMSSWVDYEKWFSIDNFYMRNKRIDCKNKYKYDQ